MTSTKIDQIVVRQGTIVEKNNNNKRKFGSQLKDNRVPQQAPFKKPNVSRAYTIRANERKAYAGNLPYSNKCKLYHVGLYTVKCSKLELDSFDVIIGIDWLANHHKVIICDEKIMRIPYEDEVLIVQDKSEEKRLEDVPTIRDFLEVFPKDFPGLPPTQQVEFQINLVLGAALVARAPHRLAPSKLQELSTQLHSGLAGYYQRFIEGFLKIAKPMTKPTQKNIKFDWSEKEEAAFQLLKWKLCSASILALPEGSENFMVYGDDSRKGLGAILMQRENVIAYASRQLKIYEKITLHVT
nr:reverse transcriptase domain-containing protein [Tanacetum cinerariifolium]